MALAVRFLIWEYILLGISIGVESIGRENLRCTEFPLEWRHSGFVSLWVF